MIFCYDGRMDNNKEQVATTEVSIEKGKIMTNSIYIRTDISMNGQKLEEVTSFRYLGDTLCKDAICSTEVRIRIASAMAAMARLNGIWRCNTISFTHKFKLYKSLVTSILRYGCETLTVLADSEKRIQAFKTKCKRKLLRISYMECKMSNCVQSKIDFLVGPTGTSSGISHATTAFPKSTLKTLWRLGDTMVS